MEIEFHEYLYLCILEISMPTLYTTDLHLDVPHTHTTHTKLNFVSPYHPTMIPKSGHHPVFLKSSNRAFIHPECW